MSGIAIYLEGGGDGKRARNELRLGMDAFLSDLKERARAKKMHWKLVPCGGRDEAYRAFLNAEGDNRYPIRILLVDAEEALTGSALEHLRRRDRWSFDEAIGNLVHLMVQTMEAWIVADPDALAAYYGQKFNEAALPKSTNLEIVSKKSIAHGLASATRDTLKGEYHKIQHVQKLLASLSPGKVQLRRPNCARLFDFVRESIAKA